MTLQYISFRQKNTVPWPEMDFWLATFFPYHDFSLSSGDQICHYDIFVPICCFNGNSSIHFFAIMYFMSNTVKQNCTSFGHKMYRNLVKQVVRFTRMCGQWFCLVQFSSEKSLTSFTSQRHIWQRLDQLKSSVMSHLVTDFSHWSLCIIICFDLLCYFRNI